MQGLADGYFILPYTLGNYIAGVSLRPVGEDHPACLEALGAARGRVDRLLKVGGKRSPDSFHRELGLLLWDKCGMARSRAGLESALTRIPQLREEFWQNVSVLGGGDGINQSLEKAGRVADFMEFGELICRDALARSESCGGHFREESQTEEGEAKRDDEHFAHVAAWAYRGESLPPERQVEPLAFDSVHLTQRSYK